MESPAIWLFDGVCVLCSASVRYALRNEKAPTITFVAIQSTEGRKLAEKFGVNADEPATFLFIEDNKAYEKSDAVIALARHLKAPASFARFGRVIPRVIRDAGYTFIAHNRYRLFGRRAECLVPTGDLKHRFIV